MSTNYREISKTNWIPSDGKPTTENVMAGSLQRIADASEKMASNFTQLQADRDLYKRWYEEGRTRISKLENVNRSLRGHITRLKKKNR